jgi:hypothetical protein
VEGGRICADIPRRSITASLLSTGVISALLTIKVIQAGTVPNCNPYFGRSSSFGRDLRTFLITFHLQVAESATTNRQDCGPEASQSAATRELCTLYVRHKYHLLVTP